MNERATAGRIGRRPGNPDTQGAIVDAARELFIAKGFRGATIREVAERANVDPALVYHYFRSKRELLMATIRLDVNPLHILQDVIEHGTGPMGVRIIDAVTRVWESAHGSSLASVISGALSEPDVRALLVDAVGNGVVPTVVERVAVPAAERELRGALLENLMVGLILGRYVVRMEPLASLPRRSVVLNVGAMVDHVLFGRLK